MKKLFITLLILLLLIIGFTPMILSTSWGNELITSNVEKRFGGNLKAESMRFSWTGPQVAKQIQYKNQEIELSASSITYGDTFIALLRRQIPKTTSLENGKISGAGKGSFSFATKENTFQASIKEIPLEDEKTFSAEVRGNFETGSFQFEKILYDHIQINKFAGIWDGKHLEASGFLFTSPFTLNAQMQASLEGIKVKKPIEIEGSLTPLTFQKLTNWDAITLTKTENFTGKIQPFTYSFTKKIKVPVTFSLSLPEFSLDGYPLENLSLTGTASENGLDAKLTSSDLQGTYQTKLKNGRGTLDLQLQSEALTLNIAGSLNQNILTLRKDLQAQLTPSKKLATLLYKNFDVQLLEASQPITLTISKKGFSLPLYPLNLRKFEVKSGQLQIGQIIVENIGVTSNLGGLLKAESSGGIHLWFTPADFSIHKGKITIERTDFLFQKAYHFATWGTIDLAKRKVNMIFGIPAKTLEKTLSIPNLPIGYVLQIPFKGPFGNVELDSGAAAKKIAWLIARKQAIPSLGGWGQLFSGITDATAPASPPSKHAFPWKNVHK
ncbi:MAG: hypothetical protein SNF33_07615 [Candidatus Algichlamydia australiensis]|nr:hypothetical protein [Chlamydiales bacterium]